MDENVEQDSTESLRIDNKPCVTHKDHTHERMTTYHKWHLRVLSLGLVLTLGSIIIFYIQLSHLIEQNKRSIQALSLQKTALEGQTWQMITSNTLNIDKLFIEKSYLRPYFYAGAKIRNNDEHYQEVMAMAEMLLDYIDIFEDDYVRTLPGMGNNGEYWPYWEKYFADMFSQSPALCKRYRETRLWYTGEIMPKAAQACKEKN